MLKVLIAASALFAADFIAAAAPALADEEEAARYNAEKGGVSMAVMRDGELVFERYSNGGGPQKAYELASGTKSFSGIIAAAAVQDGLLTLDERAAKTLPEWRGDKEKSKITIRQILSLTSGIKAAGVFRPPAYEDAIARPIETAPGSEFEYDPVNFQIFGEIMRRKLQHYEHGRYKDAVEYLQARILDPLGIKPAQWNRKGGYPTMPSGADLTARDWARFGEFVMEGGKWNGAQLVDVKTLKENFKGSKANPAYGLTWWLNENPGATVLREERVMRIATDIFTNPKARRLPDDLFMAAGAGGQRLYVIPSLKLVVVRQYPKIFERARRGDRFSDVEFLLTLLDR